MKVEVKINSLMLTMPTLESKQNMVLYNSINLVCSMNNMRDYQTILDIINQNKQRFH